MSRSTPILNRHLGIALVALVPLAACGLDPAPDFGTDRIVEIPDDELCVTLYAGQWIDVGTVCVTVDNGVDTSATCGAGATGVLYVEYATTGGWTLEETHLAVGDIPTNNAGNPRVGHFPYAGSHPPGTTTVTYAVPLCEVGLDGAQKSCDPVEVDIAAHAVVKKHTHTETAWGDGERIAEHGSWAEMFSVELLCEHP